MTDDGFVFDDADDNGEESDEDEPVLFGRRTDGSRGDEIRRFGTPTTDESDSPTLAGRIRTAVRGEHVRTVSVVALAVVLVVALGLVAYPLVMGALDTAESPDGTGVTGNGDGVAGSSPTPTARPTEKTIESVEPTTAPTVETTTVSATTTPTLTVRPTSQTVTATQTPLPTRGFPAGDPINETNESA